MEAKILGVEVVAIVSEEAASTRRRRSIWPAMVASGFAVSGLSFAGGAFLSLAAALEFLSTSTLTASLTVGLLLFGFVSAFFGAHALDKIAEERAADKTGDEEQS